MNAEETSGRQADQAEDAAARISTASAAALEKHQRRSQALGRLDKNSALFDPGATVAAVAQSLGISERSVYTLGARKRAGEPLLDRPRDDRGKSRLPLEIQAAAEAITLPLLRISGSSELPIAAIRERLILFCKAHGLRLPSRGSLRRYLEGRFSRPQRVFVAEGPEGYLRRCLPKPPVLQWCSQPNDFLVMDHQQAHAFTLYKGRRIRPWVTAVRCLFSGRVLAVYLSPQANAWAIGCALRLSIEKFGVPRRIYSDLGLDFLGKHIEVILRELGVELVNATGRSPWCKGSIESFFSSLERGFYKFYTGYTGNKPTAKPLPSPPRTMEEFSRDLTTWTEEVFNRRSIARRRMNGKKISYVELFESVPYMQELPRSKHLVLQLLKREIRQVGPEGIKAGGLFTFWADELIPLAESRETVEIRLDPSDLSRVWVFHRGRYICQAHDVAAREAEATEDDVRERIERRRRLLKAQRDVVDPQLLVAQDPNAYLAELARQRRSEKLAAGGGGRGRVVPVLLPRERTASRPSSVGWRRVRYDPFS